MSKQKYKDDEVTIDNLREYAEQYSDYSFELFVLKMLRDVGIKCEHGGVYTDPITNKTRQFDIRAKKTNGEYRVRLAIECKNIRSNFPILVLCSPRQPYESYHHIASVEDEKQKQYLTPSGIPLNHLDITRGRLRVYRISEEHSIYKPFDPVGKDSIQVGRQHDGRFASNDNDLFDKWSQCLSSANDLINDMYWDGHDEKTHFFSTVIPIVVVPNGRLFAIEYDVDGNVQTQPHAAKRCSMYIDKQYTINTFPAFNKHFNISHMEIMTIDGLDEFIKHYILTEEGMSFIFSKAGLRARLAEIKMKIQNTNK